MRILIQLKMYFILFFTLGIFNGIIAQDYFVFHVKGGIEIVGKAFLDTLTNQYVIKTIDDKKIKLEPSQVVKDELGLYITNYAKTFSPPNRVIPPKGIDTWTNNLFFRIGIKGITHYVKSFSTGGEVNLGVKWDDFIFGVGSGIWYLKDENRYPVFIYLKKYLTQSCYKPFVVANVGYIFDRFTYDDIIIAEPKATSKFASFGLGLEFPLSNKFALTIDTGYKYITIPTERASITCDKPIPTLMYLELHAAYLRLGISF